MPNPYIPEPPPEDPTQTIYSTRYLDLKTTRVMGKNGRFYDWDWVRRRKTTKAVVVVPFVRIGDELKIVVISQFRVPAGKFVVEFPAGLMDKKNENELDVARRELKEETGLNIEKVLFDGPQCYNSPGLTDESVAHVFVEADGDITTKNCGKLENISISLLTREQVKILLRSGCAFDTKCWLVLNGFANYGVNN